MTNREESIYGLLGSARCDGHLVRTAQSHSSDRFRFFIACVVCCVLPVAYFLATTLWRSEHAYVAVALDSRQQGLLFNTALLGVGTAVLATAIGAPLGIVLARVPLRRRGVWVLAGAPVLLPPYIVALAWVNLGWDWLSEWTTAYLPPLSF